MLCYAWNILEESGRTSLGKEEFDNIYNLLAKLYINGINGLLKRGLNRYYVGKEETLSILRGKLNIADSLKKQTICNTKMVCQHDDFLVNIKLNQILKATINILIKSPQLDDEFKDKLVSLRFHFADIEDIRLSKSVFSSLRYHRNNCYYRMLINISELIYQGLITNESSDEFMFSDFVRDTQMEKLYEKFVLNFYRVHLDKAIYHVHAPKINWNLDGRMDEAEYALLPEMRTDIVVENRLEKMQLIIDTKYYVKALVSSNWTEIEKVRTAHLFQILAYVNNSNFNGSVKGMLLYPLVNKEIDAVFPIGGKKIAVQTLNLNTEWGGIIDRLLSFVE